MIAFWVLVSNTIAVSVLASAVDPSGRSRSGSRFRKGRFGRAHASLRSVVKNLLIIDTVLRLIAYVCGLTLQKTLETMLRHIGNASLSMGLLTIGAGLRLYPRRSPAF